MVPVTIFCEIISKIIHPKGEENRVGDVAPEVGGVRTLVVARGGQALLEQVVC